MVEDTSEKSSVSEGAGRSGVRERVSYDPQDEWLRVEEEMRRASDKTLLRKGPDKAFWEEIRSNRNTPSREEREMWEKRQELLLALARGELSPQEHIERVKALNQTPEIPKTTFRDRLRNIGRGIEGFLSQPAQEARRLREAEMQSNEAYKEIFKNQGKRLKGASGFLRGLAAAAFKGIGGTSTNIGERLEPKPDTSSRPTSGTLAPGPGLNNLK